MIKVKAVRQLVATSLCTVIFFYGPLKNSYAWPPESLKHAAKALEEKNDYKLKNWIEAVSKLESRDLLKDSKTKSYLDKHPVILSMTSSPERVKYIPEVLDAIKDQINQPYIQKVVIALPAAFKDKIPYIKEDIAALLKYHEKIEVIRPSTDIGPITKMSPAIQQMQAKDPQGIVISIDDDIGYPPSLIPELIYSAIHRPSTVSSGSGQKKNFWQFKGPFPKPSLKYSLGLGESSRNVDLVEGFGSIGYVAKDTDLELMHALADPRFTNMNCKLSDDLVISFVLALSGIQKIKIRNDFIPSGKYLYHFPHGFGEDALQKGRDMEGKKGLSHQDLDQVDGPKYRSCHEKLVEVTYESKQGKLMLKSREQILRSYYKKTKTDEQKTRSSEDECLDVTPLSLIKPVLGDLNPNHSESGSNP